ncbi:MAG TPA: BlaI/MecI/CopY family transcriptional regulator [Pirellulales bacterium]|nr:BlaI/MecI/CopY family transcriptional regulator [Pirellulales bacterium]
MPTHHTPLSETELEVLKVLWDRGSGTVREVNELLAGQGRRWAYTTVLTLLARLEAKRYVASDKSGLAHVFRPLVSRDKLLSRRLDRLAAELCDGTTTPLVHALVQGQRFTAEEIERFRELLDELEAKPQTKPTQRKRKS